jgi:4-amino-4-deoxy-L-arabinose transferase-like glycosyltransferase
MSRFSLVIGLLILFRIILFFLFIAFDGEYLEEDSGYYLWLANNLIENHVFSQSAEAPFAPQIFRTPGYPAFLAMIDMLGMKSLYWVVFWQELLYGLYMAVFYYCGKPLFGERIIKIGLLFLLLEPGGLSTPKMILSETLFMPFFLAGLLAIGFYLRRDTNWRYLMLAGALMGLGAWVRPGLIYLPWVMACTLLVFNIKSKQRWLHVNILLLTFLLVISPWLIRNHHQFGKVIMSGQQSNMLANYHVPVVWESALGLPFWDGHAQVKAKVNQEVNAKARQVQRSLSVVEIIEIEQQIALQELSKFPAHYLKQWIFGILKTMNGANLLTLYHAFDYRSERLHFFAIKTTDFKSKVTIFLANQDYLFLIEVILRVVIAGFALLGIISIVKRKDCFLWLVMLANFYFICTPGPMGYARFRFPVEVFWFIQAYYGFDWFSAVIRKRVHARHNGIDREI